MPAVESKTSGVGDRNSARMNFRTRPHIKNTIQRAAALSGVDDSVFVMNAAYKAAVETINTHERTVLQPGDYEAFFTALDNPPPPTKELREAFERYKRTVISR